LLPFAAPALVLASVFQAAGATPAEIIIRADGPGIPVSPALYGAFFEDINRAGDGGLYAEMLQNRSFEDYPSLLAWTPLENRISHRA
jgi:hypothetical protein